MSDNIRFPWWHPMMGTREQELVAEVIAQQFPNDGAYSDRMAAQFAEICQTEYAVAVTSGTAALAIAVMACGIGAGDEVIVPDITFIATANAVQWAGATPILVDVREHDFMIDPEAIERAITPRTRAIMPVHVSGRAAPMDDLRTLADRYHLRIIEDAAEALSSQHHGKPLGGIGDAGCFSLSPAKTITTGQGGVVVTNDPDIAHNLILLKDQGRPVRGTGGADDHVALGYNFKFTNLQGAMGLAQLEDFPRRAAHQRQLFGWYQQMLPASDRYRLLDFDIEGGIVPQWVDIWVDDRDNLHDYLLAHGAQCRKFWYPLHTQPPYKQSDRAFPASMTVSQGAMWLPSALSLTQDDVAQVCQLIGGWLAQ